MTICQFNEQCTIYNEQCTIYNVQCTIYNVQCTMYNPSPGAHIFLTQSAAAESKVNRKVVEFSGVMNPEGMKFL
ncbi:MAG: hypothetical protein AMXMBFR48_10000 [Ignavibacteriales bacterium]